MSKTKEDAINELQEIIDCFEDMSDSEEERKDYYLDRLIEVHSTLVTTTAELVYELHGMGGVFDFAKDIKITKYDYCPYCDTEVPRFDGACLVCGQT
jgi:hypothetical protein